MTGRWCSEDPTLILSLRTWVCSPNTRIYVRLLGPCFKTGRLKPFRQHPKGKGSLISQPAINQLQSASFLLKNKDQGQDALRDYPADLSPAISHD